MIHPLVGRRSRRSMDYPEKITTKYFENKMELVLFVSDLLRQYDGSKTLQLTMIIAPGAYEVSYVTPATIDSSAISLKMTSEKLAA
jgi:hypothetical protein